MREDTIVTSFGMKTLVFKLVEFSLGLSLLVGVITPCLAYEDCNAIYVNGEESKSPGKCTTFPECPVLFDIIKSPYKTSKEIKLIQQLTCQPDNENPTVCCAIDDIVSETSNVEYAPKPAIPAPSNQDVDDRIVFGSGNNKIGQNKIKSPPPVVEKDHPNFGLMPSLKECGKAVNRDRIIGGELASILDYPWLARIGYLSHEDGSIRYLCAGTVINKRYILSAAHCTQEVNPEEYEPQVIRLGEPDEECDETFGCSKPIDIPIEAIIPHENYNKRDKSNDIGLIRLAEDIPFNPFVSPVCLPFVEEYGLKKEVMDPSLAKYFDTGNRDASVAGWGKTRWNDHEGSPNLRDVKLPVISQRQCQKNYQSHTRVVITEKQLCAGGERDSDSCGGDSGGGLFIPQAIPVTPKSKRTVIFQFGVVSFGPTQCGVGGLPGVYSNIYSYKKWILDQLKP